MKLKKSNYLNDYPTLSYHLKAVFVFGLADLQFFLSFL